jgi:hypothetical protein
MKQLMSLIYIFPIFLVAQCLDAGDYSPEVESRLKRDFYGMGVYDEKEYEKSPARFHNDLGFWYGIKSFQTKKYKAAYVWFGTTKKLSGSNKMAVAFAAHALLANHEYMKAEVFYTDEYEDIITKAIANKGLLISFAMQRNKAELEKQLIIINNFLREETNIDKKVSCYRLIMPVLIYLKKKNDFIELIHKIDDKTLGGFKDIAQNYARGVELFGLTELYKKSEKALNAAGITMEKRLETPGILYLAPDNVNKNALMQSRMEKIATVVFDINAAGWGDCYDFPEATEKTHEGGNRS